LSWSDATTAGFQNVLVFAAAGGTAIAVASSGRTQPDLVRTVSLLLYVATGILAVLYGISLVVDGLDTGLILSPRQFALVGLLCLAWTLSAWRHGSWPAGILSAALLTLIALSLSRTALAVGLMVLLPFASLRPGSLWGSMRGVVLAGVAGALLFLLAITSIDALQERFDTGDVRRVSVGVVEVDVNVQGRPALWRLVWNSFRESPWIGHGAGSAQSVVTAVSPHVGHPLNDYLRILHDYGIVGFAVLGVAGIVLVKRAWRPWRRFSSASESRVHLAAILGLFAVAAPATTDNSLVYIFTMGPLAILLGCSSVCTPLEARSRPAATRTTTSSSAPHDDPGARGAYDSPPHGGREDD
jgi:O-antigen ligase